MNILVWFFPCIFIKGSSKYFLFFLSFLFSSSYWVPIFLIDVISDYKIPPNVAVDYIEKVNILSIYAGIFFYLGVFLLLGLKKTSDINLVAIFKLIETIKLNKYLNFFLIGYLSLSLLYSYMVAFTQIGVSDRIYFMDEIRPFWYVTLLPFNSIVLLYVIFYEFRNIKKRINYSQFLVIILSLLQIFLIGFDGSRRPAIPIAFLFFMLVFLNFQRLDYSRINLVKLFFISFSMFFLTSFLSLNRSFYVGWEILSFDFSDLFQYKNVLIEMFLSPTPTLHVNTQMLQYVDLNGIQGYSSYFLALGNLFFPKFIFGFYPFGEPLVVYLHKELGWYGQDFGFMAEAIYSGGLLGVIILHLLMGVFVGFVIKKSSFGHLFYIILIFGIMFGFINSLRSDFMNLIKSIFYPTITIYLAIYISSLFRKNIVRKGIL